MKRIKVHTVTAIIVLIVSAAWVVTGKFSAVGTDNEQNGQSQKSSVGSDSASTGTSEPAGSSSAAQSTGSPETDRALRTVAVMKPAFVDHQRVVRVSGVTSADKRATLSARATGTMVKLAVEQGSSVAKDALIMAQESDDKAAMVVTAEAVLAQRQREFDAVSRLVKSGSSPKLQQDTAQSALATAQSELKQATIELDRQQLTAPFAGIIDRVDVDEGDYLQEGSPVAILLQLDPIVAKGEVSENDLALVRVGDPADVRLVSGERIAGVVRHISREASAQTRTFPVEVSIPNPQLTISSGMTAEIILRGNAVRSVLLPRSVITLSKQGDLGIRILDISNQVGFVPIELIDDTTEGLYLGGISTDARIIVAGQDLVSDGDQVNVVEADATQLNRLSGAAIELVD